MHVHDCLSGFLSVLYVSALDYIEYVCTFLLCGCLATIYIILLMQKHDNLHIALQNNAGVRLMEITHDASHPIIEALSQNIRGAFQK